MNIGLIFRSYLDITSHEFSVTSDKLSEKWRLMAIFDLETWRPRLWFLANTMSKCIFLCNWHSLWLWVLIFSNIKKVLTAVVIIIPTTMNVVRHRWMVSFIGSYVGGPDDRPTYFLQNSALIRYDHRWFENTAALTCSRDINRSINNKCQDWKHFAHSRNAISIRAQHTRRFRLFNVYSYCFRYRYV